LGLGSSRYGKVPNLPRKHGVDTQTSGNFS